MSAPKRKTKDERCQDSYLALAEEMISTKTTETAAPFVWKFLEVHDDCAENRIGYSIVEDGIYDFDQEKYPNSEFYQSVMKFVHHFTSSPFSLHDETLARAVLGGKSWVMFQSIKDNLTFKNKMLVTMSAVLESTPRYSLIRGFRIPAVRPGTKILENTNKKLGEQKL